MTTRKPLLIQKDRRGVGRIPARDFLTPTLRWPGAPDQVELINISIGGLALEYTKSIAAVRDVFEIDLQTPDGFTVKNLPFEKLDEQTIETEDGKFETTIRGRFLDLPDDKLKQLKKIVYHSYQHHISRTAQADSPPKNPGVVNHPNQISTREQTVSEDVVPICSSCKRIRDPHGTWHTIEDYIQSHQEVNFSHSICPHCAPKMYPWITKEG